MSKVEPVIIISESPVSIVSESGGLLHVPHNSICSVRDGMNILVLSPNILDHPNSWPTHAALMACIHDISRRA